MSAISGTIGALTGASAAKKAAKAEQKGAEAAAQAQLEMFYTSRQDLAPWKEAGVSALRQILGELGLPDISFEDVTGMEKPTEPTLQKPIMPKAPKGKVYTEDQYGEPYLAVKGDELAEYERAMKDYTDAWNTYQSDLASWEKAKTAYGTPSTGFRETPGYEFRFGEGVKALERGAAARGKQLSGQQQKNLIRFGQDIGSAEYGNYIGRLFNVAGLGQVGSTQSAQGAMQTGTNLANLNLYSGAARGSAYRDVGNIWGNFATQQGQNAVMAALAYYGMQNPSAGPKLLTV